jgi:hypothetical protein
MTARRVTILTTSRLQNKLKNEWLSEHYTVRVQLKV